MLTSHARLFSALESLFESESGGTQVPLGKSSFTLPAKVLLADTVILCLGGSERVGLAFELHQLIGGVIGAILLQARRRVVRGIVCFTVADDRPDILSHSIPRQPLPD